MRISELAEKPREKALLNGLESLSDTELLALLIESGSKNKSAFDLAMEILSQCQGITHLNDLSLAELMSFPGIKQAKALRLLGALEIARRISFASPPSPETIHSAKDIYYRLEKKMVYEQQEHFFAVYLDVKGHIIREKLLFKGSLDCSVVHPREVFKEAIHMSSASIIVSHNHPSGDPTPSKEDEEVTEMLVQTGRIMQIPLLDHVIIARHRYFSFREAGLIS